MASKKKLKRQPPRQLELPGAGTGAEAASWLRERGTLAREPAYGDVVDAGFLPR